jgi:chemotaxis phosphatase CheX-like protein
MGFNTTVPCARVIEMHVAACTELFQAYGLTGHLQPEAAAGSHKGHETYASVLSASGEGIRLSSTLSLDRELLVRTHPSGASDVPEREVEDWCRELNNQLVGRLKNKLLRAGCEVSTGLPVLIRGTDMVAVTSDDQDFRQYFFSSKYGNLAFTLAMLLSPDLTLVAAAADAGEVRAEGAMALF